MSERWAEVIAERMVARFEREERRREELLARMRRDAARVAAVLRGLGAERVILFGSVAWGSPSAEPDIDIAVAGIPPGRFFAAWAEAAKETEFPLELHELDRVPDALRRRIEAEGEPLP